MSLEDKVSLSKSILKLVREITNDADGRICFESRQHNPMAFVTTSLKLTFSCLGILKCLDIQSGVQIVKDTALSLLKKGLRISI